MDTPLKTALEVETPTESNVRSPTPIISVTDERKGSGLSGANKGLLVPVPPEITSRRISIIANRRFSTVSRAFLLLVLENMSNVISLNLASKKMINLQEKTCLLMLLKKHNK